QAMAAGQEREHHLLEHVSLPDDDFAALGEQAPATLGEPLGTGLVAFQHDLEPGFGLGGQPGAAAAEPLPATGDLDRQAAILTSDRDHFASGVLASNPTSVPPTATIQRRPSPNWAMSGPTA